MQLFTRNQTRWNSRPISDEEAARFRTLRSETGIGPNMSHGSYLVNLATTDAALEAKSVSAFLDEIHRADLLGLEFMVFHPGSHKGLGIEAGLKLVTERLDRIIEEAGEESRVTILLENTAGQGTNLGFEFSHLRDIMALSSYPERLGVCIDTCHTFGAGYEIRTREGYEKTMAQLAASVTLEKVMAFHLNDSIRGFGTRKDRHAGIGEGVMGLEPFRFFVNDPLFRDAPATLETPGAEEAYRSELKILRGLSG